MINLWQQICDIADFDKNNEVDTDEFMKGVETACKNKNYDQLPEAFKFFIEAQFRTIDVDGNLCVSTLCLNPFYNEIVFSKFINLLIFFNRDFFSLTFNFQKLQQ